MVHALEKALERDIQQLDWMTPATKKRALEKLHAITNKIGYPEKWRDYPASRSKRATPRQFLRPNMFEFRRQMAEDRQAGGQEGMVMTPPTVNAYYDPQNNNINFPAGILQPPFYDNKMDDAVNFGGIGAVIGHELTHGFDDQGGQFDAKGNLRQLVDRGGRQGVRATNDCVAKQYADTAQHRLEAERKADLGENIADNGGLRIAYMALMDTLAGKNPARSTASRRSSVSSSAGARSGARIDRKRRLACTRRPILTHLQWRVNGTVSNMPEFRKAFGCKVGAPMVRGENACRVW